ncbi:MAG: GDSL-type esterase/lipase family protein [Planctomycetaceae bacterium]
MSRVCWLTRLSFCLLLIPAAFAPAADLVEFNQGDHICYIGNTLGERMQHDGWLETLIQMRFPEKELVFRNLCFSGDELNIRLRSADFGSPDDWLTRCEADVIFLFFGYNESFKGEAGLDQFKTDLANYLKHLKGQKYNGESAPKLVLMSPIEHENLPRGIRHNDRVFQEGDPNLPDGVENNKRLEMYTAAMAEVAASEGVVFCDIFHKPVPILGQTTINGVHLNTTGNKIVAGDIDDILFPTKPLPLDPEYWKPINEAVRAKNAIWYQRYRTTDGYSVYGGRSHLKFVDGQTNREVAQREMEVLDVMTANRDARIWQVARMARAPRYFELVSKLAPVDDSNVPPFIPVVTNKPGEGPNGEHLFLSGEAAIEKMTVHSKLQVNLFASEEQFPELVNPVQMSFDTKGRCWVAAWPLYPHWKPLVEEMDDKLLILEDTDGDGKADVCKTFAGGLHNPTGFEFWNGGVLVACCPDLWFLKDTDGDDVADVRERVLHGLDSADTHHGSNSFTLDPGGALYFQEGTFHHTQVETPYGPPVRSANAACFRYEPRTQKFEVYTAYGFANPHGHVFDRWGQDFLTDGTGAVNYFATAFSGRMDFPRKHARMDPFFKQRTRPCPATEILSSRHFPEEMAESYLIGNVIGFQGIMNYKMIEKDSGFEAEEVEPIVFSSDPNFRPVDLEIAPDGSLYFTDWQNPIIGHMQHNLRDPSRDKKHGRVYRVTAKGRDLLPVPKIDGEPIPALLELLKSPENRTRYRARIELSERNTAEVIAAVSQWVEGLDGNDPDFEHHLCEALWMHQHHNVPTDGLLRQVLTAKDYHARAAATRVVCYWRDQISDPLGLLMQQANDAHPRVRLEAVRAASFFEEGRAAEVALQIAKYPRDYYLDYTLGETMKQLEPYWKKSIESGEPFAADNPDGIEYILSSVSTQELMKLPRSQPVYMAFLSRPNIVHDLRHEAVQAMAKVNGTDPLTELLSAVERADRSDGGDGMLVLADLSHMLTGMPQADLSQHRDRIEQIVADAKRPFTRQLAYVTLMTADGSLDPTWQQATADLGNYRDILDSVAVIPDPSLRAAAYERVAPFLDGIPADLKARVGDQQGTSGRFVRIQLKGKATLTLAEVQVFSNGGNIATSGKATQSQTAHGAPAQRAIDGNTSGAFGDGGQTHTPEGANDPWWELDLGGERPIESIVIWNRTDDGLGDRLNNFTLQVLDASRSVVWEKTLQPAPKPNVTYTLEGNPGAALRRAAIAAVVSTGQQQEQVFRKLAKLIQTGDERATAVKAITRLPSSKWAKDELQPLVDSIIADVSALPADARTSAEVRDSLQLGDSLASLLPAANASAVRKQLRELGVPVVMIRPVPHQMKYDRAEVYVEAGKPIELVFENIDIMPHNLLIGQPSSLQKIGLAAEKMATDPNAFAQSFAPKLAEVIAYTRLLQPRDRDAITLQVPSTEGDYPFICTFPGHWRTMNGVLHVVKSLDDVPADVLAASQSSQATGPTRDFVRKWTVVDLEESLAKLGANDRDLGRGQLLFTELACIKCHKLGEHGGAVGPDFAETRKKIAEMKFSHRDLLISMIEPSKVIEDKFKVLNILKVDGTIVSGVLVKETDSAVYLAANPLDPQASNEAIEIPVTDIEERLPSEVSLMPEGLLNTCTQEEILDLLQYVLTGKGGPPMAGHGHGHKH